MLKFQVIIPVFQAHWAGGLSMSIVLKQMKNTPHIMTLDQKEGSTLERSLWLAGFLFVLVLL